jgi:hypothetical protein
MKTNFIRGLFIALLVSVLSVTVVLAHGDPTITVEPAVAAPGGQITIKGADMEDGEVFKITLESASGIFELGQETATQNGNEAGFTAAFKLSSDLAPGSYLLRCVAEDGHTATADMTIASSGQMNTQTMEASAAPLVLDRSKPPMLIGTVLVLALLSAGLGVWLIRLRE